MGRPHWRTTQKQQYFRHGEAGNTGETMGKLGQSYPHTAHDKSGPMLPKANQNMERMCCRMLEVLLRKGYSSRTVPHRFLGRSRGGNTGNMILAVHAFLHTHLNRSVSKVVLGKQRVLGPQGEIDSCEEDKAQKEHKLRRIGRAGY